jgi:hypothetical protein
MGGGELRRGSGMYISGPAGMLLVTGGPAWEVYESYAGLPTGLPYRWMGGES